MDDIKGAHHRWRPRAFLAVLMSGTGFTLSMCIPRVLFNALNAQMEPHNSNFTEKSSLVSRDNLKIIIELASCEIGGPRWPEGRLGLRCVHG